jgi:hypothetical protein
MNAKNVPTTSVFATANTNAVDIRALIADGLENTDQSGEINWKAMSPKVRPADVPGGSGKILYSRAWLIVRRAWLEVNEPSALVTLPEVSEKDCLPGEALSACKNRVWSKLVQPLRDGDHSWGEIAVRCGKPESKIRASFRATQSRKDLGDRIGKGGRFAFDEPEFYLEHRKAEGAHIPVEVKSKPKVEQLLNAKDPKTGKVVRFQRVATGKKAVVTTEAEAS